jgi:hypothetical protein
MFADNSLEKRLQNANHEIYLFVTKNPLFTSLSLVMSRDREDPFFAPLWDSAEGDMPTDPPCR